MELTVKYIDKIDYLINSIEKREDFIKKLSGEISNKEDKKVLSELRNVSKRDTIINLYTYWESYIKKIFLKLLINIKIF